ncbi:hypothetical protein JAAARDRAFT_38555 [Jaapia argillacea MUCL 33604]|uniref:Uncharacterized protein n=1 Tax=Jaapia argillacea MUCL 33604 TaxID=933084 RepID=A0A067PHK3_9AGAM|nr:hypothetical protein JAAARDRAFT_38555 [Jaapia argillacea MUCL 33604]
MVIGLLDPPKTLLGVSAILLCYTTYRQSVFAAVVVYLGRGCISRVRLQSDAFASLSEWCNHLAIALILGGSTFSRSSTLDSFRRVSGQEGVN